MRPPSVLAASVVVALLSAPAVADDKRDCPDHKDYDTRIKSCSEIIRGNPSDAIAYHNRGTAHQLKGDLDRAIADFDKAIELQPNYASAYNSRGLIYATKGDYTHALADVTRADELAPKTTPRPKTIMATPRRKAKPIAKAPAAADQTVITDAPATNTQWVPWSKSP